jgi:hypothetical protein
MGILCLKLTLMKKDKSKSEKGEICEEIYLNYRVKESKFQLPIRWLSNCAKPANSLSIFFNKNLKYLMLY